MPEHTNKLRSVSLTKCKGLIKFIIIIVVIIMIAKFSLST